MLLPPCAAGRARGLGELAATKRILSGLWVSTYLLTAGGVLSSSGDGRLANFRSMTKTRRGTASASVPEVSEGVI